MEFNPLDTQKLMRASAGSPRDLMGVLLAILVALIAWIGTSLINRVDQLAENFNSYALRMENRVTAIEQKLQTVTKKDP